MKLLKFFLIILSISLASEKIMAAPISITQISNLDFGTGLLGDPQKRIQPGNSDNFENASFLITGDPGRTFSITLPNNIQMRHLSTTSRIRVNRFRSRPRNGRIRNNGERLLLIGATRATLANSLTPGKYAGTFTVTVIY